jgi:hypothetical protein
MKILLINDASSNCNWGGRAATAALASMIGAVGGEIASRITDDDIQATSFLAEAQGPEPAGRQPRARLRAFVPPVLFGVQRRIGRRVFGAPDRRIPRSWGEFEPSAAAVIGPKHPWRALLEAVHQCDVALVNGDGDIDGDGLFPRTMLFLSYLIKKHVGKPVVMVNHTVDLGHPTLLEMARHVYPLFDDVVYREPMSAARYQAICGGRVGADTAFAFRPIAPEEWCRCRAARRTSTSSPTRRLSIPRVLTFAWVARRCSAAGGLRPRWRSSSRASSSTSDRCIPARSC